MKHLGSLLSISILSLLALGINGCATSDSGEHYESTGYAYANNYRASMPSTVASKEKMIVVDPNIHSWGAYNKGQLVRSGMATAGASWCPDIGRPCKTRAGKFRIQSLGSASCKSTLYPLPRGGAPMPYCMFFNGNQGLHGSNEVVAGNISHGCVRLNVGDASWIRHDFASVGTKVVVKSY